MVHLSDNFFKGVVTKSWIDRRINHRDKVAQRFGWKKTKLLESIKTQAWLYSSLDEQAVSCYTEEKQSQEGEGDEKDTLCVSRHYLQKSLKSPVISRFFRLEGSATTPLLHHF